MLPASGIREPSRITARAPWWAIRISASDLMLDQYMNRIPRRNFLKHAAPAGCLSGGLVAASNRIAIVTPQRNLVVRTRPLGGRRVAAPGGRERRLMRHGVFVLSRLFRRLFLEYLLQAFDTGKLQFFSSLEPLHERCAFLRHLAPTRHIEWGVYAKR